MREANERGGSYFTVFVGYTVYIHWWAQTVRPQWRSEEQSSPNSCAKKACDVLDGESGSNLGQHVMTRWLGQLWWGPIKVHASQVAAGEGPTVLVSFFFWSLWLISVSSSYKQSMDQSWLYASLQPPKPGTSFNTSRRSAVRYKGKL